MGGPPGNGSPSTRATLSKASPAASSMVRPRDCTSRARSGTSSSELCPPETSSAIEGSASGPCWSSSTATCAARWLTPYSGLSRASAYALAAATPTSSAPVSPGPEVTATASTSSARTPASASARCTVGTIASRCAREAISGTTPPKRSCSAMEVASASASRVCPRTSPTPVSSQEVSNPRTMASPPTRSATAASRQPAQRTHPLALHDDGVGAAGLVVAAAPADLHEPAPPVEALGRLVVGADLEQHHGAALVRLGQECVQQECSDPLALQRGGHAEGGHVGLVVVGDQPAVADDDRRPVGLVLVAAHVDLRDDVVPGVAAGELVAVHRLRPGVRGEQLLLQPHHDGQVLEHHRPQCHCHARDTALMAVGGVASGRRRYSGRSGPADDGSASCGPAARSNPAVVTSAGTTSASSRGANAGSPTNGPVRPSSSGRTTPGPSVRAPSAS